MVAANAEVLRLRYKFSWPPPSDLCPRLGSTRASRVGIAPRDHELVCPSALFSRSCEKDDGNRRASLARMR